MRNLPFYKSIATLTPLYSHLGIGYQQAYSGPYEDLSYYGDDAVVIAAIKGDQITGFGRPVVAAGSPRALKTQMERLYKICPNIWLIDYLAGGTVSAASKYLLSKDSVAKPYYTQVIDLTKSEEELHAGIRKSYTSLINWGNDEENCHLTYQDCEFFSVKHWEKFRELHITIAGKETRPQTTWMQQFLQIQTGEAFAILMYIEKELVAGSYFVHNQDSCYYFTSASLPEVNSHVLLWQAILYAKWQGCRILELGEQVFSGDEKLVGISSFKRGFGGDCKVRLEIKGKEEE